MPNISFSSSEDTGDEKKNTPDYQREYEIILYHYL